MKGKKSASRERERERGRELTEEKDGDDVSFESIGDGQVDGRTVEDGSDRKDREVGLGNQSEPETLSDSKRRSKGGKK